MFRIAVLQHESEYLAIVAAVKGSSQEKRLASQFIAKFFKHFPKHGEQTLNAMFDLCEDDDVAVRIKNSGFLFLTILDLLS